MIDKIKEILENKWAELESQDEDKIFEEQKRKLMDIVVNLDAINDFSREYEHYKKDLEKKKAVLTEQQTEILMSSIYRKWTFIFCAILNLDLTNPFVLSYMHEALMELMEEE